jgi:hypothetical protein
MSEDVCIQPHCTWILYGVMGSVGMCVERNSTTYTCSDINRYAECLRGGGMDVLDGRCFWVFEDGGSGFCVVEDDMVCGDLLVMKQCDGDDAPPSLEDGCFWLMGNDLELSSQKINMCMNKVCS